MKITTGQALKLGYCRQCNSYQKIYGELICVATRFPSLNYRNTPVGQCALTEEQMERRQSRIVKTLKPGKRI